ALVFKHPPGILFQNLSKRNEANVLALRIQPDEGTSLKINCKVPGLTGPIQPVKMDFRYGSYFGINPPEAYERLILDCMLGDNTLFARQDEVYNSWKFITPILEYFSANIDKDFPNYAAGSWGPKAADQLLLQDRRKWRLI
ncbi:MAG: glucose-6-phosphate dehydrogenase, partial [Verrucomicrobiota bacterium]